MHRSIKKFILAAFIFALMPSPAFAKKETQSAMLYQKFESEEEFETYETADTKEIYDPYEKFNRKIYAFNDTFDRYFLEHIAKAYRKGVPQIARKTIRNFLTNLSLPISAMNSFLQGNANNGLATFSNFLINSTVGIGGLFDIAGEKGIRYRAEDFGQTLGHYGKDSGAYLVIPILGPSSTRDFSGWIADKAVNPLGLNELKIGGKKDLINSDLRVTLLVTSGIDTRESLIDIIDDLRQDSFDPYATIRSAYLQKRLTEIKN
jgi:phospholipid-binding lipoprotein MlaA